MSVAVVSSGTHVFGLSPTHPGARYDISATAKTIVECDAAGANQKSVASTVITEVSDQAGFHEKTGSVQVRALPSVLRRHTHRKKCA